MPATFPQRLRDALGEEASNELARYLRDTVHEQAVLRDEYRQVLTRLDVLEHDVEAVKEDLRALRAEMNEGFRHMNERFDRMNERFDHMNERFDQMYERMLVMMRWTVGTIALFGTLVTVLLAIAAFFA